MPRWPSLVGHRLGKAVVAGSNPARGLTKSSEKRRGVGDFTLFLLVKSHGKHNEQPSEVTYISIIT